ncbi:unnamed protein product [Pleuronectes platessa]|uniref:Uncharacterized protein n=1 Tax=Pleuronectes platessa TaxID=8262 RepID=A0A9N7YNM0_PLEPL|nr:unnamed protein product [Pleuronectes platessa]
MAEVKHSAVRLKGGNHRGLSLSSMLQPCSSSSLTCMRPGCTMNRQEGGEGDNMPDEEDSSRTPPPPPPSPPHHFPWSSQLSAIYETAFVAGERITRSLIPCPRAASRRCTMHGPSVAAAWGS